TAFAYERLLERDGVHLPSPNQEGIGGAGRSLIAMAAALHDQAKLVFSGEVDRGDDIVGLSGGHRIDAGPRCPGADPAGCLRQSDLIADVVGVSQRLEDFGARWAVRRLATHAQGRFHLDQSPFNRPTELVPTFLGRPSGISRRDAGEYLFLLGEP